MPQDSHMLHKFTLLNGFVGNFCLNLLYLAEFAESLTLTPSRPECCCWSGWISDSYCSIKPLCSGMGEVVPARTSLTLLPHPLALCCDYPVSKCLSASIVVTGTVRVNISQTRRNFLFDNSMTFHMMPNSLLFLKSAILKTLIDKV